MSPRSSKQFEQIRQKKKKLITDVALELFAENGFHATSISQITKKANISKGLIYNYFESKNDILEEITNQGFQEIRELLDPNKDGFLTEEEFISFIEKSFELVKNNHKHWKLFFSLMIRPAVLEDFATKYVETGVPIFRMMHEFIASKGSVDPEGDLMIINSMIEGALLYAIAVPDIFPIDKLKEKIKEGIFRIIYQGNHKPQ
jgi:AcrR family transcriptional regulator